jgi:MoxR-like ATPase
MRLSLGYPSNEESVAMLLRFMREQPMDTLSAVAEADEVRHASVLCTQCHVDEDVLRYMTAICEAARDPDKVRLGPSSRALLALLRCCQALAAIRGRDYVVPDDVKELSVPVLAHRVILRGNQFQVDGARFIRELLKQVPVPTECRQ